MSDDLRIATCPHGRVSDFLRPISWTLAGRDVDEDGARRFARLMPEDRMLAAFAGDEVVGAAGSFAYELTVPGGAALPAAGVSVVAVLPTHRRRGVLTRLMRAQLDDCRRRGEPLAALFASEEGIYGRYRLRRRLAVDGHRGRAGRPSARAASGRRHGSSARRGRGCWRAAARVRGGAPPAPRGGLALVRVVDGAPAARRRRLGRRSAPPRRRARRPGRLRPLPPGDALEDGIARYGVRVLEDVGATLVGTREVWRHLLSLDLGAAHERRPAAARPPAAVPARRAAPVARACPRRALAAARRRAGGARRAALRARRLARARGRGRLLPAQRGPLAARRRRGRPRSGHPHDRRARPRPRRRPEPRRPTWARSASSSCSRPDGSRRGRPLPRSGPTASSAGRRRPGAWRCSEPEPVSQ